MPNTDDVKRFRDHAHAHTAGGKPEMSACVVTLIAPPGACEDTDAVEFEVRLIPFQPLEGELQVCFQLASEMRQRRAVLPRVVPSQGVDNPSPRKWLTFCICV